LRSAISHSGILGRKISAGVARHGPARKREKRRVARRRNAGTATAMLLAAVVPLHAARPVARWDVVPDQRITGVFKAGVCAFHVSGVEVEFRVDGRLVHTARRPTMNDRTGVWEFWLPLAAADYPDGPLTIEARAVPLAAGHPAYDLPPLTLHANGGGTLSVAVTNWVDAVNGADTNPGTETAPFRTLAQAVQRTPSGGTVNLKPGSYFSQTLGGGSARPYWTTIQAAPGVERDAVEIAAGRPGTQRLRWRNVTLFCDVSGGGYTTILIGENGRHSVWLDNCRACNKQGRWAAGSTTFGNRYVAYVTGGVTEQMANGPGGSLIRGHLLQAIASDAWTGSERLVVNCACRDIDPGDTGAHPDFHQSYAVEPEWVENVILYNVRGTECVSQGLFGSRLRHSAFVNVLFAKGDTVMCSQYSGPMENVLFLHLGIVRQTWLWRDGYTPVDVQAINGIFQNMSGYPGDGSAGLRVDHNHFVDASRASGSNATTGDPRYRDPAANDFRLAPDSPARGNGTTLQCVPADIDGFPHPAAGRNRGVHADPPPGTVIRLLRRSGRRREAAAAIVTPARLR
jgi:hypothetical protein